VGALWPILLHEPENIPAALEFAAKAYPRPQIGRFKAEESHPKPLS